MNTGRQAFEIYNTFSQQQKRFLNEKDLEDTKTLEEWLSFLEGPVAYDTLIDKTTLTLKMAIRLLWAFAGLNVIIAIITASWYLGLLAIAMAGLAVYQRLKRASYFKRDLHNHLRLFFYPALGSMNDFLGSSCSISVHFWLREKDKTEHIIAFSFEHEGHKTKINVLPNGYQIEVNDQLQKTGNNLSHSSFISDLRQALEL